MLQYVVNSSNADEIINCSKIAIDNGCRWLRLDLSAIKAEAITPVVDQVKALAQETEAIVTIENAPELVSENKLAGVHIANCDASVAVNVRRTLGEEPIMGLTLETPAQVPFLPRKAIDYVEISSAAVAQSLCGDVVRQMRDASIDEPVVARISHERQVDEVIAAGVDGLSVESSVVSPKALKALITKMEEATAIRLQNLE